MCSVQFSINCICLGCIQYNSETFVFGQDAFGVIQCELYLVRMRSMRFSLICIWVRRVQCDLVLSVFGFFSGPVETMSFAESKYIYDCTEKCDLGIT